MEEISEDTWVPVEVSESQMSQVPVNLNHIWKSPVSFFPSLLKYGMEGYVSITDDALLFLYEVNCT